jgi:uncharacterized membrane protein YbhN (UPF0104 family)
MILPVWRWLALLKVQGLELAWPKALKITWVGYFCGLFMPGAAGGDLARAYLACQNRPDGKTRAVSTVLMDRIVGLQSLLLIGIMASIAVLSGGCSVHMGAVAWSALLLFSGSVVAVVLMLSSPALSIMLKFLPGRFRGTAAGSLGLYRAGRRKFINIGLYSCLCNTFAVCAHVSAAMAIGDVFSYGQVLAVPLVGVAKKVPISLGGLGVGETVGALLFAEFGSLNAALVIVAVRMRVSMFSFSGLPGLFGPCRSRQTARSPALAASRRDTRRCPAPLCQQSPLHRHAVKRHDITSPYTLRSDRYA